MLTTQRTGNPLVIAGMVSNSEFKPGTSTPLGGIRSVFGGFDSHALPPMLEPDSLVENPFITDTAGYLSTIQMFQKELGILSAGLKHVPHFS